MNWKRFRNLPLNEKQDECMFIVGIDIGDDSTAIAYYNAAHGEPEIIDISGGYGRPSVPTVIQYVYDTKEWVFGEYAVINKGAGGEITLSSLIQRLGRKEYIEIDNKPFSIVQILSMYLKDIMSNIRNINPKAEIAGIVAAVPSYMGEDTREELFRAFAGAGYEKEIIEMASDRECVFSSLYLKTPPEPENVLIIDFGSREVRGGVYRVETKDGEAVIKSLSSLFDPETGTKEINDRVGDLFTDFYLYNADAPPTPQIKEQINAFVYQHKDLLFQKSIRQKPIKLYFNFTYPPFMQTVSLGQLEEIIKPFESRFIEFVYSVLEKNVYEDEIITSQNIHTVLCTGGGFEMLWAREAVMNIFQDAKVTFYKNSKGVTASGAAVLAASRLGVADLARITIEDRHQLSNDIGIRVLSDRRERFIPVVERNSFWWQEHPRKLIIINEPIKSTGEKPPCLRIYKRAADGEERPVADIPLDGLPERPRGATRLSVSITFKNDSECTAAISDAGFGELFPKTDYERTQRIIIAR